MNIHSPIIHLVVNSNLVQNEKIERDVLVYLVSQCHQNGVGVSVSKFSFNARKKLSWRLSIRLCASALYNDKDIKRIVQGFTQSLKQTRKQFGNVERPALTTSHFFRRWRHFAGSARQRRRNLQPCGQPIWPARRCGTVAAKLRPLVPAATAAGFSRKYARR